MLKKLLKQTIFYDIIRSCKAKLNARQKMRTLSRISSEEQFKADFYSQLLGKGDLVFDVGANLGNRTKLFLQLGARVIAVEPQPQCASTLKSLFGKNPNFVLERTALGAAPGVAEMAVSNFHTISSLSQDWIEAVQNSGRFSKGKYKWDSKIDVKIETLDNLVARYGEPSFIKIDVEGYEYQVLRGLSKPIPNLALEFTPEYFEDTMRCIDHLTELNDYSFQVVVGESTEFALENWVGAEKVKALLPIVARDSFGDLYCRHQG